MLKRPRSPSADGTNMASAARFCRGAERTAAFSGRGGGGEGVLRVRGWDGGGEGHLVEEEDRLDAHVARHDVLLRQRHVHARRRVRNARQNLPERPRAVTAMFLACIATC